MLVHLHPELQFVVEVDASDSGVRAITSQHAATDQKLHPCVFLSCHLTPVQRIYDVGNRESLAVISAFQEWRHCSEGAVHPFVVWTGHKSLSHLRSVCRLNSYQTWWALFLCHFKDGAGQSRFGICPVLCVLLSPCFLVNSSTLGGI